MATRFVIVSTGSKNQEQHGPIWRNGCSDLVIGTISAAVFMPAWLVSGSADLIFWRTLSRCYFQFITNRKSVMSLCRAHSNIRTAHITKEMFLSAEPQANASSIVAARTCPWNYLLIGGTDYQSWIGKVQISTIIKRLWRKCNVPCTNDVCWVHFSGKISTQIRSVSLPVNLYHSFKALPWSDVPNMHI